MSVINKMLRDLDHPPLAAASASGLQTSLTGLSGMTRGTASVDARFFTEPQSPKKGWWFACATTGLALMAGLWWLTGQSGQSQAATSPVAVVAVSPPMPITPEPPAVLPAVTMPPVVPVASLTMDTEIDLTALQKIMPMPRDIKSEPAERPKLLPPREVAALSTPVATLPLHKEESRLSETSTTVPAVTTNVLRPASADELTTASGRRDVSAVDMTGQAQRLWNAGSRDAAIALLKDALAIVESAAGPDLTGAAPASLVPLVRELARMELAEGQTSQVLELLRRLEPALAGHADLWAVRANAAQRQALHQEAIAAYQSALALRPGESRWMLGAAVSMAARGQTAAALELAEKARARGAVSRDVVAYLRQLGVPLSD